LEPGGGGAGDVGFGAVDLGHAREKHVAHELVDVPATRPARSGGLLTYAGVGWVWGGPERAGGVGAGDLARGIAEWGLGIWAGLRDLCVWGGGGGGG
jgi:hypothetical protein